MKSRSLTKALATMLGLNLIYVIGTGCEDRDRAAARKEDSGPVAKDSIRREETSDPIPGDFEGTAGIVEKQSPEALIAVLRDIRTARHEGFDRVVFEFDGEALPGYHLEYVDDPVRECGSGDVVSVAGDSWLEVRFIPSQAHTDSGEPTVKESERHVDHPNLKEIELTCDFEAHVTWVLGLSSPNRYRVLELAKPTRLVVDVKH